MRLFELQKLDKKVQKFKAAEKLQRGQDGYKDVDRILHYQELLFIPKVIQTKFISWYYNDPLAKHFGINKTREFISQKYYWLNFRKDVAMSKARISVWL